MFATPLTESLNKVTSIPAPVGGLNARDSIVAMGQTDAIILRNWWPQPYGCSIRKGYRKWAEGLDGMVHSLAGYAGVGGAFLYYAWAGTDFYNITTTGAVGAPVYTGLADNVPWQHVQLVNAAGAHLIAVNGANEGIIVSSGIPARITAGDGIAPNTWAGLDPSNAVQVTVHQHRLWAVEKNTANGWFLPPDAIQGTFQKVDFGPLFSRGGFLLYLATWTMDDGNGAEDHLVAMSSEGQAAVFAGSDPEDDTKWALVGVYYMGQPVAGRRSYSKVGGDLIVLTQQGAASMSETLVSTKVENNASKLKSDKIQYLISTVTSQYGSEFGWQLVYLPELNMLMINVPTPVVTGNLQLASNQLINSWTEFTNMDAASWFPRPQNPLFGDYAGNVWLAWFGESDGVQLDGSGGSGVLGVAQQAYSYYGSPAMQKQIGMYRPNLIVTVPVRFKSNIVYDFIDVPIVVPDAIPNTEGSLWDVGLWNTATWGGGTEVQRAWVQALGMGNAASLQLVLRSTGEVLWVATDYSYVSGWGIL
jgi:hypothetical protein